MKKKRTSCDIFISYRRVGGEEMALAISKELKQRHYDVFFDREGLRAPGLFNERLLTNIQSCKDFVLILSPHALDRCVNEDDWVRKEIEEAFKEKKRIISIMMGGFEFPQNLPESIEQIRYVQALTPTMEYFDECIDRLCKDYLSSKPHRNPLKMAGILFAAVLIALFGTRVLQLPILTPDPGAVDVRSWLEANTEIQLKTAEGKTIELYGDTAPADLGAYPKGSYYSATLTLKNTGGEDVGYTLSAALDGERIDWDGKRTCAAGQDEAYSLSASMMKAHLTPGKHSVVWYVNGRKISTFKFKFTEEKRPDLRETLKAAARIAVFNAQGKVQSYVDGTSANLQDLPEGGRYEIALTLENQGEEEAQFHLALMDQQGGVGYWASRILAKGAADEYYGGYPLSEPGEYELTWYAEGYPVLTQAYTIRDEADVRDRFIAGAEMRLVTSQGETLERYDHTVPLDLGEYPQGSYYSPALTLTNTGSEDVSYRLSAVLDGEAINWDDKKTCAAGRDEGHCVSASDMEARLTPGRHAITWYVNGYEIKTFEFEFTEEKRPDLRETLNAMTRLVAYDSQDKRAFYLDGTVGNLQKLPEGGRYKADLMLGNSGEEDVQFHLVLMDREGHANASMSFRSLAGDAVDEYESDYLLNEPGDYELTWYAEGYPILTQTYTITDEAVPDVRSRLEASAELVTATREGYVLELRGDAAPLDLGEYPEGSYYYPCLTLKNTGSEDVSYMLSVTLDEENIYGGRKETCAAGEEKQYSMSASQMQAHQTPGKHSITWHVNGYAMKTFEFEFTEEKRPDLRGTLGVKEHLGIWYMPDNLFEYDWMDGNLRDLGEGEQYVPALRLDNQGDEDVQFHLALMDNQGYVRAFESPISLAKNDVGEYYSDYLLSEPGDYELTWYVEGYPILTEPYTVSYGGPDVRDQLKADAEIQLVTSKDFTLERYGDTAPLDTGGYPEGTRYTLCLTLKNTKNDSLYYTLSALLDGEEIEYSSVSKINGDLQSFLKPSSMQAHLTPGKHSISWYVNGYEIKTFDFEFTEDERPDLRETLKATTCLSVYNAYDRHLYDIDGTSGNLQKLPEGGQYKATLKLENPGNEEVRFHLALIDQEEKTWHGDSPLSVAAGAVGEYASGYALSEPGLYELTWYVEGYPILTQRYTITDAEADVRGQLEASAEIALLSPEDRILELCGDTAPLDVGGYPEGSRYYPRLTLKNKGSERVNYTLSVVLDGEEIVWNERGFLDPGEDGACLLDASKMEGHLTPGKHSITWYANGYRIKTFEFEFTEEKRPDLRKTLKATPCLAVCNEQDELQYFVNETTGNLQALPEGSRYVAAVTLENQGDETAQFHLAAMDHEGYGDYWRNPQSLAKGEKGQYFCNSLPNGPGEYLTVYAEGYPVLTIQTQTYTITDETVPDVRSRLEASIRLEAATREGYVLELRGDAAPLDLGEYPEGSYYYPCLTLSNTGNEDVGYMLSAALDGEYFYWDGPKTCAAGHDEEYSLDVSAMEAHLTPGKHSVTWYVNGREIKTFEFEFTEEKRPDLRETLKATTCLAVYNAQGERQNYVDGTVGNLQALKEGEYYQAVLTLKNQGDEEAQFHLALADEEGLQWYWDSPMSVDKGAIDKFFCSYPLSEPGEYELTWYAEGYPVLTQTYTILDQPDVRGRLETSAEFAVINYEGQILEHCGDMAPLDLGDYPEGSCYSLLLTLKNTGSEDVDYVLSAVMDEELFVCPEDTLAAGDDVQYSMETSDMEGHLTPGRHSVIWSVNGYEIKTLDFEFTEEERPDLRATLKASGTLCVYDADGKLLYYTNSVSGNVRDLPEGASYGLCLRLENQAETDAEFRLMFIADGQSQTKSWPEPQRIGAKAEDVWQGDYRITNEEEHKLTWYVQGYPILTQRYTIEDE